MYPIRRCAIILLSVWLISCSTKEDQLLFELISAETSGIDFSNDILESDQINILQNYYTYNGAGVGIGDFNNDGLSDIYFTGNMVSSRLYLNNGNLQFRDITEESNTLTKSWATGVAIVDIDQNGWDDIYISVGVYCEDGCNNLLFLNKGLNQQGIPEFDEVAGDFGLSDPGHSTQSAFLDYDRDGDLDVFIIRNEVSPINKNTLLKKDSRLIKGRTTDRLYKNLHAESGSPMFRDVTLEAGISFDGYSLGVAVNDINNDGWPDIYVANDFKPEDLIYINQTDGTFKQMSNEYLIQHSANGMGVDIADFNNDGLPDIVVADMLPESNLHQKTMLSAMNYNVFKRSEELGYGAQYMRNTLQLNNGQLGDEQLPFSEIGRVANVFQTDWSWAPLMADFDLDGDKDLYISNGFYRDMTDLDFINYAKNAAQSPTANRSKLSDLYKDLPGDHYSNYMYVNQGGYSFADSTNQWGLFKKSFSNGAAYADFDNDGDLDLVVNNLNEPAFLIENHSDSVKQHNFIGIQLKGPDLNLQSIGAKVVVWSNGNHQVQYTSPIRGYLSSVDKRLLFGLNNQQVDSMLVQWSDGKSSFIEAPIKINRYMSISYEEKDNAEAVKPLGSTNLLFQSSSQDLAYKHSENAFDDFKLQPLLFKMYSMQGPVIEAAASGETQILFTGASTETSSRLYVTKEDGTYQYSEVADSKSYEDTDAIFFDVDNDGDKDLYVASGGYSYRKESDLQDRIYLNDGSENFSLSNLLDQVTPMSTTCVSNIDFDNDGDMDVFVGTGHIPGKYPLPGKSQLLINENGGFTNKISDLAPELEAFGIITDAVWSDINSDGAQDLIVVGEWMSIAVFLNENGKLVHQKELLSGHDGFWQHIQVFDMDNDGDDDYLVGNLGLNSQWKASQAQPIRMYASDYDDNGTIDPIVSVMRKNEEDELREFPFHARDEVIGQIVKLRTKYKYYKDFGEATIQDLFSNEQLQSSRKLQLTTLVSGVIKNNGNGNLEFESLPDQIQLSTVTQSAIIDLNSDGFKDLIIAGNDYSFESNYGRYDASLGSVLLNRGDGSFLVLPASESGLLLRGQITGLEIINKGDAYKLLAAVNSDSLLVYDILIPTAQN